LGRCGCSIVSLLKNMGSLVVKHTLPTSYRLPIFRARKISHTQWLTVEGCRRYHIEGVKNVS